MWTPVETQLICQLKRGNSITSLWLFYFIRTEAHPQGLNAQLSKRDSSPLKG